MKIPHGFSLVEMAVVLVIIGFLIGAFLIPMSERMDQQKIALTQQRLEEIKKALLGFAITNGYLPCPAKDTNGIQAAKTDSAKHICDTYDNSDGYLPWATLGVERYDAWGRPFRYRVDGYFSNDDGAFYPSSTATQKVGTTKDPLTIKNRQGQTLNIPNDPIYNSNIVAIVFSCGKNGRPDSINDADSNPNADASCQNNGTANATKSEYIQDVYVEDQFDDILLLLPKNILINRLTAAGNWPPPHP